MPEESSHLLFAEFFNQKLKERGYTLSHLSDISGISLKHLEQFSHGRFEHLPPTPYLRGYFVRLGKILGFDADEWWNRIREDESVQRSGRRDSLPVNRFSIRRKRALAGVGLILIVLLLYVGFRASKIVGKPDLTVTAPAEETTRISQSHILVTGTMENGDEVSVNGDQIPLEEDGSFHKNVSLVPGMNDIDIVAKKILGRETKITRHVYYDASPTDILLETPGTPSSSLLAAPEASSGTEAGTSSAPAP